MTIVGFFSPKYHWFVSNLDIHWQDVINKDGLIVNPSVENPDKYVACPQCDALALRPNISEGQKVICKRCGGKLFDCKKNSIDRTLAISLAGLLLIFPAITLPIIGISLVGQFNQASLVKCIQLLLANDYQLIAFSLFLFTIAIPIVRLIAAFYIAYSLKLNRIKPSMLGFFRSYHMLDSWTMLHVFVLGIMVSMYKLVSMASLTVGLGFIAFMLLLLCSTLISVTLDHHLIWQKLEQSQDDRRK